MMKKRFSIIVFLLVFLVAGRALPFSGNITDFSLPEKGNGYIAFCYHDVVETLDEQVNDSTVPVLLRQLVNDFDWLKANGYTVISVHDILAANRGEKKLPPKSVLITFDDGYKSFYTYVYPLAKAYNYPVLLAIETRWLDTPHSDLVDYGGDNVTRSIFLTWEQIQEMAKSKLIDFAGHSDNLHRGIPANPQGNAQPAAVTLLYDNKTKTYETVEDYKKRVEDDLRVNYQTIMLKSGKAPVAMVWPYGECTQPAVDIAFKVGFKMSLTLSYSGELRDLWNTPDNIRTIRRTLMAINTNAYDSMLEIRRMEDMPQRVVHADLDYVYSPDPAEQEKNLGLLMDRLAELKPSAVYLQAYADADGNGTADALYFPNRHLPMKSDLFDRAAWQIATRIGTRVYAWMPVMGFDIGDDSMIVKSSPGHEGSEYRRLSIFNPEARRIIKEIYEDLAMYTSFKGILYHDDAILGDYEDISESGLRWMEEQGLPPDIEKIHADKELLEKFSKAKTKALIDFTEELTGVVRQWDDMMRTARNIYAKPVLDADSEAWYAQNYIDFLYHYDYTAIMAMPYMENAKDPDKWLKNMVKTALRHPLARYKAVFELQTIDWRDQSKISSKKLAEQMLILRKNGVMNYGYYPDDFIMSHPDLKVIKPAFSSYPYQFKR